MSYTTKLHTLRMLKKQAADLSDFATPAIATGLGAVGGLGVNEFILKNKSLKSKILSALLGGGIGLGIERLVDYGAAATTRDGSDRRIDQGEKTTSEVGKALREKGIDPTPKNIDTFTDLWNEHNNYFTNKKFVANAAGTAAGMAANEWWRKAWLADAANRLTSVNTSIEDALSKAKVTTEMPPDVPALEAARAAARESVDDLSNSSILHVLKNIANIVKPTMIDANTGKKITRAVAARRAARGARGPIAGLAASIGWNALAHNYLVEKALRDFKTDKTTLYALLNNK